MDNFKVSLKIIQMQRIAMPRNRLRSRLVLVCLILGFFASMMACGKKGPLYLPDEDIPPKKTDNQIIAPEAPPLKNIPTTSP